MISATSSILQPVPAEKRGNETPQQFVYGRAPLLIYWESTRACDLACVHCRAMAVSRRHPQELRTDEVVNLLEQIVRFGAPHPGASLPHLIITGGDPLQRPDLIPLIQYATMLKIPVSVTPAGTTRLTPDAIAELKAAGTLGLGLSLDGPDAERHDAFRGEDGSFNWTISAALAARRQGMPLQINTMVTAETLHDIPEIFQVVQELEVTRWALFFLIKTGRGEGLSEITPEESERFLNWLWRTSAQAPFPIKTTEAHHYRRIAYLKLRSQGLSDEEICRTPAGRGFGIRDGNGILFISHTGNIYPSGFLPKSAGNVRHQDVVDVYRHSDLFRRIRDVNQLQGKCGRCEFRAICGGSRARAFAATGDPMAADPLCPYIPRQR